MSALLAVGVVLVAMGLSLHARLWLNQRREPTTRVRCPRCGARPGRPCRPVQPYPMRWTVHGWRREAHSAQARRG